MDLSKLPKLSETPKTAEAEQNQPPVAPRPPTDPPQGSAGEAWISIAIGAILLLVAPTMLKYISSRLFGTTFAPFLKPDGTEVPYPRVYPQFLSDLCVTLFAIVLILDGITIGLVRRLGMVLVIFLLTVLVTLMNLLLVIFTTASYGVPLISAIAVAIGGYMAMQQFAMIQRLSAMKGNKIIA